MRGILHQHRPATIACAAAAAFAVTIAIAIGVRAQEPPRVSPPLSPERALKTFRLPDGYALELVASEPLVQDPVAIDWDPQGRLWVVEMPGYMRTVAGADEHAPIGRVVVLRDADGDGRMDARAVFADGLVMPRAVKVLDDGVLVGEPPNLWLMPDTNGDLRMDTKTAVTDRYGRRVIDPQNNANGLLWALDNRIHTTGQSDTLLRPAGNDAARPFAIERAPIRGQWGVTQDDAGRIFRNTNESALHVDVVPSIYFARHPTQVRTRGLYERLADGNPDLNQVWPARPTPATNRAYQLGILREDGTLARYTAVCAPLVYRGDRLPRDLYGSVFVAEPAANLVSRIIAEGDEARNGGDVASVGVGVSARKAYARGEFVASTDERFRPVFLSNAPDGTLVIVDMYRGILEHTLSMTEYLRDQIAARGLEQPIGMGRIYRVVHQTTTRDALRVEASVSPTTLIELLTHPNGWWRDTAQRLIVERRRTIASAVRPTLTQLATSAPEWHTRLQVLWTLDGIDAVDPPLVTRALDDASPHVRAAAIRIAERWLAADAHPIQSVVLARRRDPSAIVRRQLAASLGVLPVAVRVVAVTSLLDEHADDPIAMDAAISGLHGIELIVLDKLLQPVAAAAATLRRDNSTAPSASPTPSERVSAGAARVRGEDATADAVTSRREAAIAMLAATVVREAVARASVAPTPPGADRDVVSRDAVTRQDVVSPNAPAASGGGVDQDAAAVSRLLAWIGDERRAEWQRAAVLRGAEIALLGAEMPGTPAPRASSSTAAAPCPNCPGARGGPGGAYAYTRPTVIASLQGGAPPSGAPMLRLDAEPRALTSSLSPSSSLAPRVTRLLTRVSWPGKPGEPAPAAPLTAAERARFDAGQEVYRNVCQACHQPDGRGQDKIAPPLIGSTWTLGPADVAARILIHGKEGPTGLMPPVGSVLGDAQIADVLTFVRRSWGHAATPVVAATVAAVRARTKDRTRPWTEAELKALVSPSSPSPR